MYRNGKTREARLKRTREMDRRNDEKDRKYKGKDEQTERK